MSNPFKIPFGRRPLAVSIDRGPYVLEMPDGKNAEITMYGEIVESQPVDGWTGEPVLGNYIIQSEFLEDLKSLAEAKTLTIHMHSVGGDAGVSILIHNRLRELASQGMTLKCIVDGVAMSGGSLIMCACDNVEVNPSSIIMIHKCWSSLWGGYNADELKELAARNEAWDKAQVSIYKRKCSLSDMVISNMMAKTTYMTGTEAVEKGFADRLLEDAEPLNIAASADGRSLFVRGRLFHLTPGMFAPDTLPTVTPEAAVSEANTNQNGGTTMANTLEELRTENPELAEARAAVSTPGTNPAVPDPVQAERTRIQEIDALAGLYDEETIQAAKYGENACTAQEMTYRAAQKAAQQGKKYLDNMGDDYKASGVQGVSAVPPADDKGSANPIEQARADARAFNERRKGVR